MPDETWRLRKIKAPCEQKTAIIRARKLPKAFYGCELTPANETALRVLRSSFIKCMTYTTSRRPVDLVFSVASEGAYLDRAVNILVRRVAAFRTYVQTNKRNEETMSEIYRGYKEEEEP